MRKKLLVILWIILSAILPACGTTSYEELEAEAVRTGDTTKLDEFERRADQAAQHFEYKSECRLAKRIWYCPAGAEVKPRKAAPSIERVVRDYRKEKRAGCTCVSREAVREIVRNF